MKVDHYQTYQLRKNATYCFRTAGKEFQECLAEVIHGNKVDKIKKC